MHYIYDEWYYSIRTISFCILFYGILRWHYTWRRSSVYMFSISIELMIRQYLTFGYKLCHQFDNYDTEKYQMHEAWHIAVNPYDIWITKECMLVQLKQVWCFCCYSNRAVSPQYNNILWTWRMERSSMLMISIGETNSNLVNTYIHYFQIALQWW